MAKSFDVFGIVLMMVAIAVGTMVGGMIGGMIGFAGGLIGSFLVGFITYVIWTFLVSAKIDFKDGLIFSVLIYIAQIITGYLQGMIGFGGALVAYLLTAVVFSLIWGLFGGGKGGASKTKPISVK
jgi:hypothetical protein